MPDLDHEKRLAAARSLDFVTEGMVVGLGSGSTAAHFIRALGASGLAVECVATSEASAELGRASGLRVIDFEGQPVDVTVDGADEIGPDLALIKGGGGALVREKIVAFASRKFVIIADSSKPVEHLGKFPLPVEVLRFGWLAAARAIERETGVAPIRRVRGSETYLTNGGNYILDCPLGRIADPPALASFLDGIPGLIGHGLFIGMASVALVGRGDEVESTLRGRGSIRKAR